jgi:ABC-type sulfate transport system permease component
MIVHQHSTNPLLLLLLWLLLLMLMLLMLMLLMLILTRSIRNNGGEFIEALQPARGCDESTSCSQHLAIIAIVCNSTATLLLMILACNADQRLHAMYSRSWWSQQMSTSHILHARVCGSSRRARFLLRQYS